MKKHNFFVLLNACLFLFSVINKAQEGWQIMQSAKILNSVAFSEQNTAWAVGQQGIIKKSTDGGVTWEFIEDFPFPNSFEKIFFVSSQTGWILNDLGRNVKTTDGGNTWFEQFPFIEGTNLKLSGGIDIFFISDSVGWTCKWNGEVYKTTDGGDRWRKIQTKITTSINSIHFVSESIGWCVGDLGEIQFTNDGGLNWELQSSGTAEKLNSVIFINSSRGIAVGKNGVITATTNGGTQWNVVESGTTEDLNDICYINSNIIYAAGGDIVIKSTNGGTNWDNAFPENVTRNFYSIDFIDENTGLTVGWYDAIERTSSGGASWSESSFWQGGYNNILFVSTQIGFLIGTDSKIMKTIDGGKNWSEKSSGVNSSFQDIYFSSGTTGYIVGTNKTLIKTTDGGESWTSLSGNIPGQINNINSISFRSLSNIGIMVGNNGKILTTSNSGSSWTERTSGTQANLNAAEAFFNYFLVVGDSGVILKSTDFGVTWEKKESGTDVELYSIGLASSGKLFVGGEKRMLKSTNNGEEWSFQSFPNSSSITRVYSIDFADNLNGWAATYLGGLSYTTDGGSTWKSSQAPYASFIPRAVDFVSPDIGWVLDTHGHVIKTTNAGFKQVFPEYHSIAQIQETPNGEDGKSIYNGRYVQTSGIVTSFFIEYFGSTGVNRGYFIQDGEDKWSGIFIDASSSNLAVGDHVDVFGDVWDTDYTTIRHVDSVNIDSHGNEIPQPVKLQTAEVNKEAYEGVLVQVTGICDKDSATFYEWSVNDGSGSVLISKKSVKFQPVVGKTYSITGPVYEAYNFDDLAILVTDSSNIVEVVIKPNSVPTINLPDTVALLSDSSISLNIWESVEDNETPDSLLSYDISSSTDSLLLDLNSNSGELKISAAGSFIGSGYIYLQVMDDSLATASDTILVIVNKFTDIINTTSLIPDEYNLGQNYPNPFNPSTTIKYSLKEESMVHINVYNSIGQEVANLIDEIKPAGYYSIIFNASDLASGIYFYRIQAGSFSQVKN